MSPSCVLPEFADCRGEQLRALVRALSPVRKRLFPRPRTSTARAKHPVIEQYQGPRAHCDYSSERRELRALGPHGQLGLDERRELRALGLHVQRAGHLREHETGLEILIGDGQVSGVFNVCSLCESRDGFTLLSLRLRSNPKVPLHSLAMREWPRGGSPATA